MVEIEEVPVKILHWRSPMVVRMTAGKKKKAYFYFTDFVEIVRQGFTVSKLLVIIHL